MLETEKIDWDSFQFNLEALDETNMNMISDLFNVISDSDVNFVCIKKCLTDKRVVSERVVSERSNLQLYKGT